MDPEYEVKVFQTSLGQCELLLSIVHDTEDHLYEGHRKQGIYTVTQTEPGNTYKQHYLLPAQAKAAFAYKSCLLYGKQRLYLNENPHVQKLLDNNVLEEWDDIIF